MITQKWLNHVQSTVSDSSASEFVDPINKTRTLMVVPSISRGEGTPERWRSRKFPAIITDSIPTAFNDPLGDSWLMLEALFTALNDDVDEVIFGESVQVEFGEVFSTDQG